MSEKTENINPAIIKKTQDTLGRIIQAPSLTDKLLNRPPVQFIQDIVKSVLKNTGFMKGLYSSEELEGSYIKASKENKLNFLKKLITMVGLVIGEQLTVKESKIAAGAEADKTNELLQALAKAINMKPDNDEYVKRTLKRLKGDEQIDSKDERNPDKEEKKTLRDRDRDKQSREREDKQSKERDKDDKQSKDRLDKNLQKERDKNTRDKYETSRERDRSNPQNKVIDKSKERERDKVLKESNQHSIKDNKTDFNQSRDLNGERRLSRTKPSDEIDTKPKKKISQSIEREKPNGNEDDETLKPMKKSRSMSSKRTKEMGSEDDEENEPPIDSRMINAHNSRRPRDEDQKPNLDDNDDDAQNFDLNSQIRLKRPTSAKGGRKVAAERVDVQKQQTESKEEESIRNLPRPTTARPSAPRKRLNNETEEVIQPRLSSSKKPQTTLIVDKDSESDDDFVVKEQKLLDEQKNINRFGGTNLDDDMNDYVDGKDGAQHGALVKKILESKEQLENGSILVNKRNEPQKASIQMDAQRRKERERLQKEIEKLKESIQTLTKSSIPLGRSLDFLQEDIDMMQKELFKWKDESDQHSKALKRQQQDANLALEPHKAALAEVNSNIDEQLEKIAAVKRKIVLNEEKINKLIFGIAHHN